MQGTYYQLLALAARGLFLALILLLVLRAGGSLLRQHRARKELLRQLPDAGMVGEMRDIESDKSYPLPREGVLGGGRGCDICLKGLRRRHVTFAYVPGKGILITPCHRRSACWLDGQPLRRGAYALHGALLRVGGYTLGVRLFAGLDVPSAALLQEHWQPASGDDLYAPDDPAAAGGYAPAYPDGWAAVQAEPPLFDMQPNAVPAPQPTAWQPAQPPVYQPVQPPAYPPMQPAQPAPAWPEEESYAPPAFTEDPQEFLPPEPREELSPLTPEDYFAAPPDSAPVPGTPVRHRRSERRRSE